MNSGPKKEGNQQRLIITRYPEKERQKRSKEGDDKAEQTGGTKGRSAPTHISSWLIEKITENSSRAWRNRGSRAGEWLRQGHRGGSHPLVWAAHRARPQAKKKKKTKCLSFHRGKAGSERCGPNTEGTIRCGARVGEKQL